MAITRKKAKLLREESVFLAEESSSRFPASSDVWLNIFDKLEHSDKPAFSRAVAEWHEWVAPKRSKLLLREVAPILLEALPANAILQSRELCGSLKEELDIQYQNHPSHLLLDFETGAMNGIPKLTNRFSSTESIQRFMEEMRDHPGNPFVGKSIDLKCQLPPNLLAEVASYLRVQFWMCATHLLSRFGVHVHYASFNLRGRCLAAFGLEVRFRNCLLQLPHLRRLDIVGFYEYGRVDDFFRLNPLPQLGNLETVSLKDSVETGLVAAVLNSCCVPANIKRLSVEQLSPGRGLNEAIYSFCNLEVFHANSVYLRELHRLGNSEQKPPLKELSLKFKDAQLTAQQVFSALEPFGESLVHFKMMTLNLFSPVWGNRRSVNLPKLKRLHFNYFDGSLNILLQFRSLTELVLEVYVGNIIEERRKRRNEVQVYDFVDHMYDSNIWRMMPNLQKLEIGCWNYERRIFEHLAMRARAE